MTNSITFADLAALAIDTDALPPMRDGKRGDVRGKSDRKRSANAKRETLARDKVRAIKTAVSA